MAVDYDLVILGGSTAARSAAAQAVALNARVALVEPNDLAQPEADLIVRHALIQSGRLLQQTQIPIWRQNPSPEGQPELDWPQAQRWAQAVANLQAETRSLSLLATQGVDVIVGQGEFQPPLTFVVNGRSLRSRYYLLAPASCLVRPDTIAGLGTFSYLTPQSLLKPDSFTTLPRQLILLGGSLSSLELAQLFCQLGSDVTLIWPERLLLPDEEPELSRLLQAQFEAKGIKILAETPVTQVKQIDDKKWVQAGTQALEADEVLLAIATQPQIAALNLETVGVRRTAQRIFVNAKLQTSNPRIYACGDALGGYALSHLAQHEARLAVQNALQWKSHPVRYEQLGWTLMTNPEIARAGLTETQAQKAFGEKVQVLQRYFKTSAKAQMRNQTTGFCKLIVHADGRILGAHLIGPDAGELIQAIALALQHNLKVTALSQAPVPTTSFADLIAQTAADWELTWGDRHPFRRNLLDWWFDVCRAWTR